MTHSIAEEVASFERGATPWVYRPPVSYGGTVYIYVPFASGNRDRLNAMLPPRAHKVQFDADLKLWTMARGHAGRVALGLGRIYGSCDLITDAFHVHACTTSCQDAKSGPIDCQCVCGGASHGGGMSDGWTQVGDLLVIRADLYRSWWRYVTEPEPSAPPLYPTTIRFDSLAPSTDPDMATRFIDAWFGDEDWRFMTVSMLTPSTERHRTYHMHATPRQVAEVVRAHGLDSLSFGFEEAGTIRWNAYVGAGLLSSRPARGLRGGKRLVAGAPGVWMDLDCKDGSFASEEECLDLLRGLPPEAWPTIVVATGLGGIHAYWRTERELGVEECESLGERWWAYLSALSGRRIDRVFNADRIMKLPGSIRWGKTPDEPASLVRLLFADPERRVQVETLRSLSTEAWAARQADINATRSRVSEGHVVTLAGLQGDSPWERLLVFSVIEDWFNERYTWEQILVPHGWTNLGREAATSLDPDHAARTLWARPGSTHKSAATGYEGSHVMSLFSTAPETGLLRLLDAQVPLSKFRVHCELTWNGDEAAMAKELMRTSTAA